MLARCGKLQLPLEGLAHGAAFAPAAPSMTGRPVFKEHSFLRCASYGDREGLGSFSFAEVKVSLVGNLIGALINATEILDEYAGYPGEFEASEEFLGLQSSVQSRDLVLLNDSLLRSEPLELPLHGRLRRGSLTDTSVSPLANKVVTKPDLSRQYSTIDNTVWSSAALRAGGLSQGQFKPSASTVKHPAEDGHRSSHDSISEEDLLLQQVRFKAYGGKMGLDAKKKPLVEEPLRDSLSDDSVRGCKQAKSLVFGFAKATGRCSETAEALFFQETVRSCQQNTLFWGSISLGVLLTGVLLVTWCSKNFFRGRHCHGPSLKRRILKSQWYGNRGSPPLWDHKYIQMKVSEVPKYHALEVDGDRKLLRFPSETGVSSSFSRKESQPLPQGQTSKVNSAQGTGVGHASMKVKAQGQPIRQTLQSNEMLSRKQDRPRRMQPGHPSNGASAELLPKYTGNHNELQEPEKGTVVSQLEVSSFHGRRVRNTVHNNTTHRNLSRNLSNLETNPREWGRDDELDLDHRIQKLYQTIQAVEQHRRTAMLALEEEKQRSLALEQEMSKQREAAAALGEEVRLLKESHSALLASLQKKYSTPAAARTAADLVYQDWERRVAAE